MGHESIRCWSPVGALVRCVESNHETAFQKLNSATARLAISALVHYSLRHETSRCIRIADRLQQEATSDPNEEKLTSCSEISNRSTMIAPSMHRFNTDFCSRLASRSHPRQHVGIHGAPSLPAFLWGFPLFLLDVHSLLN